MRIYASSTSMAVARTLEEIITLSGHTPSPPDTAELILVDQAHPKTFASARASPSVVKRAKRGNISPHLTHRQLTRLLRSHWQSAHCPSVTVGNSIPPRAPFSMPMRAPPSPKKNAACW